MADWRVSSNPAIGNDVECGQIIHFLKQIKNLVLFNMESVGNNTPYPLPKKKEKKNLCGPNKRSQQEPIIFANVCPCVNSSTFFLIRSFFSLHSFIHKKKYLLIICCGTDTIKTQGAKKTKISQPTWCSFLAAGYMEKIINIQAI